MTRLHALQAFILEQAGCVLSPPRLFGLIYLADWKATQLRGRPITHGDWHFVGDYPALKSREKELEKPYVLSSPERAAVQLVLQDAKSCDPDEFVELIRSTYPAIAVAHGATMDLVRFGKAFAELQRRAA